jgi:hypothetical protein
MKALMRERVSKMAMWVVEGVLVSRKEREGWRSDANSGG